MKKLGNPTPQNYVYSTVKVLLERIAPVMIDSVAIQELVSFVSDAVKGTGAICDEIPNATENGMKLLLVGTMVMLSSSITHSRCCRIVSGSVSLLPLS